MSRREGEETRDADLPVLEFSAEVRAGEIVFEERGSSSVHFWGRPGHRSVWFSYRRGVPEHVESGRRYLGVEARTQWRVTLDAGGTSRRIERHEHEPSR